jgi:lipopolysaccharide export system permease protein
MARTLWRHVLREVGAYAGVGLIALGTLLVLQNFLRQLEDLLALGVQPGDAVALLGSVALFLAGYALPIAFLFGVLVGIGQLSADHEVKALRTLGVSVGQIAAPVFALALATCFATHHLLTRTEPAARRGLVELAIEIASRGGLIQPGRLSALDRAGERLVLVDARSGDGVLHGVFVADRTDPERPFVVAAREGEFALDGANATAHLRLRDGELHLEARDEADERSQRIAFRALDYAFDVRGVKLLSQRLRPRELSERELRAAVAHFERTGIGPPGGRAATRAEYEIQLHRRRALPLAPLLFAALGVPLALRRAKSARAWGALVCVGVVFAYYVLLSAAEYLAKRELLPPGPALWLPNCLFGALGAWLLWRARGAEA